MPLSLTRTIVAAAVLLEETRDPWWIISSAAAAIHGARPITVGDVDILLSRADAEKLFSRSGIVPDAASDHPRFRSDLFGRWTETPLTIEFMADFRLRDSDGRWRRVQPRTRVVIRVNRAIVYVPSCAELRIMFERFGRSKDLERINLLDRLA
ncbi:hypothetical protein [Sphingomonas sp. Mn802worker]|uniref:hypothetical protein n=1 Tax=Sphingomonas sp. Mn802worker TaxID=629773 RepID=UPI00037EC17C|nr:hypothetical protein [Sphingomonas sp. Mn802worker]